jgi:hypothetical protein
LVRQLQEARRVAYSQAVSLQHLDLPKRLL